MADELTMDSGALIFATLADVYLSSGMIDEAISILKDGLSRNPTYTLAKIILGRAYYMKGDIPEATKVLEEVQSETKDSENTNLYLGHCYKKAGDAGKAIDFYKNTLQVNPDNREAQQGLQALQPEGEVLAPTEQPAPVSVSEVTPEHEGAPVQEIAEPITGPEPTSQDQGEVQEEQEPVEVQPAQQVDKGEEVVEEQETQSPEESLSETPVSEEVEEYVPAPEPASKPEPESVDLEEPPPAPSDTSEEQLATPAEPEQESETASEQPEEPAESPTEASTEEIPGAPEPEKEPVSQHAEPVSAPVEAKQVHGAAIPVELGPLQATPAEVVIPFESLTEPVNKLLAMKTVKGAFICSQDGLMIQNYYAEYPDIEELCAMVAAIHNEAAEAFRFLDEGVLEKFIIEKGDETICVITAGESLLAVITKAEAKPGLVFIYARKVIEEIREILG